MIARSVAVRIARPTHCRYSGGGGSEPRCKEEQWLRSR